MTKTMLRNSLLAMSVLLIYGISIALHRWLGLNLPALPALLLLYWLPGRLTLAFFPGLTKDFHFFGRLALEVFFSLSLSVSLQIFLANRLSLAELTVLATVLNLVLAGL